MLIKPISLNQINCPSFGVNSKKEPAQKSSVQNKNHLENYNLYSNYLACINKAAISFKGYGDDPQSAKKLFWILTGRNSIYEDDYTKNNYFNKGNTGWKKWVGTPAYELLNRTPEEAIQSICTITKPNDSFPNIPDNIKTPDYGSNWGRHANYIEINPRTIAKHEYNRVSEGLLGAIKLLPGIPPSGDKFANCVVLSQLYPTNWSDGYTGEGSSMYTIKLNTGISKNITSDWLERDGVKINPEEQVKAFNDLAHLRGLKTGFRMLLSEGQLNVNGQPFNWNYHENAFIDACVKGVELGFDAIYFDSAKHIDGYESEHYCGVGKLPSYGQMQYITDQIRKRTGRNDISIIGEKCDKNPRFEQMGFTAGTDLGDASSKDSVLYETKEQKGNNHYAGGPEVSNDNDSNWYGMNERLKRLNNCLFGYDKIENKLPAYMQMNDIFPLTPYTNTHQEMLESQSKSEGTPQSHIYNIFNTSDEAKNFQNQVNQKFLDAIYK